MRQGCSWAILLLISAATSESRRGAHGQYTSVVPRTAQPPGARHDVDHEMPALLRYWEAMTVSGGARGPAYRMSTRLRGGYSAEGAGLDAASVGGEPVEKHEPLPVDLPELLLEEDDQEDREESSEKDHAEWLYREALESHPGDIMALSALADVLHRKGDVDGAMRCFDDSLVVDPQHRATLFSKALLLLSRGHPGDADTATDLLARAVAVDPTSVPCLYMYGRVLHCQNRLDEAEDMYRSALSYEPQRGDILSDYGALLEAVGGDDDAVRGMYKRAVQISPDNANALSNYARTLEERGGEGGEGGDSTHVALALYRRALAARPQHVPTMCNMAMTLASYAAGSCQDEGKKLLQRAIDLEPAHVGAVCQYARLLQEEGTTDEARRMFDTALNLHPQNIDALNGLGTIYEARAQHVWAGTDSTDEKGEKERRMLLEKAQSMYTRALALAPLHPDTLSNRGALLACHTGAQGHDEVYTFMSAHIDISARTDICITAHVRRVIRAFVGMTRSRTLFGHP